MNILAKQKIYTFKILLTIFGKFLIDINFDLFKISRDVISLRKHFVALLTHRVTDRFIDRRTTRAPRDNYAVVLIRRRCYSQPLWRCTFVEVRCNRNWQI